MTRYEIGKERARERAKNFETEFAEKDWSWSDMLEISEYFHKVARRYGLTREFIENGIL